MDVREGVRAVPVHQLEGDGPMQPAQVFSGNATTFLTHIVGRGFDGERYVVERYRSMLDGDIRPVEAEAPKGKRARKAKHTLVAITGGKDISDPAAVINRLDKAKAKYPDIILCHGGGPGVERIAAQWADRNAVHQVVCKPDWNAHGRAAPFRRNDELLNLLPKGVIAFPGSGITDNLVDKAVKLGIPVMRAA